MGDSLSLDHSLLLQYEFLILSPDLSANLEVDVLLTILS